MGTNRKYFISTEKRIARFLFIVNISIPRPANMLMCGGYVNDGRYSFKVIQMELCKKWKLASKGLSYVSKFVFT